MKSEQFWLGVVFGGLSVALVGLSLKRMESPEQVVEMPKTVIQAYNQGLKDAVSLPPSAELEIVCARLWKSKL
jgi:hypothetical protein